MVLEVRISPVESSRRRGELSLQMIGTNEFLVLCPTVVARRTMG